MNIQNTTMKSGGVLDSPLQIIQPMNILVFLCIFSPIIIAIIITSLSFIFQNFKGMIYLGFLIGCCVIRNFAYQYMPFRATPITNDKTICTSVQYSTYGNSTFSSFVFAFTIMYLSYPMFSNGFINYWVFISLVTYFFIDVFIKIYKNCIISMGHLFFDVLLGSGLAAAMVAAMYAGGSGKYLFFNEVSSDTEVCYRPSEQTFKCQMYKDGQLISEL